MQILLRPDLERDQRAKAAPLATFSDIVRSESSEEDRCFSPLFAS